MCNEAVSRLQQLRLQALVPVDPNHDVYPAIVFLGMAQKHFSATRPLSLFGESPGTTVKDKISRLSFTDLSLRILTHDSKTSQFIAYTGHITRKFLERFYFPHKAPRNNERKVDGLNIELTRVRIWPILGLRERLGQVLVKKLSDSLIRRRWRLGTLKKPTYPAQILSISSVRRTPHLLSLAEDSSLKLILSPWLKMESAVASVREESALRIVEMSG